jgi:hypothetical protein
MSETKPKTTPECEQLMSMVLEALDVNIFDAPKKLEVAQTALKRLHKKGCTKALEYIMQESCGRGIMNPNAPKICREAKDYLDDLSR